MLLIVQLGMVGIPFAFVSLENIFGRVLVACTVVSTLFSILYLASQVMFERETMEQCACGIFVSCPIIGNFCKFLTFVYYVKVYVHW